MQQDFLQNCWRPPATLPHPPPFRLSAGQSSCLDMTLWASLPLGLARRMLSACPQSATFWLNQQQVCHIDHECIAISHALLDKHPGQPRLLCHPVARQAVHAELNHVLWCAYNNVMMGWRDSPVSLGLAVSQQVHLCPCVPSRKAIPLGALHCLGGCGPCGAGKSRKGQPQMLVLAPTRELAHQIMGVLADAGGRCGLTCASATGGSSRKAQVAALRQGAAMLVATPGRLQDLVDDGSCRCPPLTPSCGSIPVQPWHGACAVTCHYLPCSCSATEFVSGFEQHRAALPVTVHSKASTLTPLSSAQAQTCRSFATSAADAALLMHLWSHAYAFSS